MKTRLHVMLLGAGFGVLLPALSHADGIPRVTDPLYLQECGSCHVPYPPRLLSGRSWNSVLDGLGQHFGTDASLDDQTAQRLRQYLTRNAGQRNTDSSNGKPQLRITQTGWFVREHQEELPPGIWKNPAVKSASNCGACHTRAADGVFNEDDIRLPKGVYKE